MPRINRIFGVTTVYNLSICKTCIISHTEEAVAEARYQGRQTTIWQLRMWAEICRSQSDSEGFSPSNPVFLPLQIRLPRQDLSHRTIKH